MDSLLFKHVKMSFACLLKEKGVQLFIYKKSRLMKKKPKNVYTKQASRLVGT